MNDPRKIYFASDFHLGVPDDKTSFEREKLIVQWLEEIRTDAREIYLLGDVFDFWFEYKTAIPKGFVRLQGKLAEITDSGIPIHYFTGNHDMWVFDYFTKELGLTIYHGPVQKEINGKKFFIGHGDGLGPGDHGYKFIKKIFSNKLCQSLFRLIHPDLGIRLANFWSGRSRKKNQKDIQEFLGEEKEFLIQFCKEVLEKDHFDYFLFGHRHLPLDIEVGEKSRYINLGEWMHSKSYAEFDGKDVVLKYYNH